MLRAPKQHTGPFSRSDRSPILALLLAALSLAGCDGGRKVAPPASDRRPELPVRLIADAPVETFEPRRLYDEEVLFELDLTAEAEQRRWRRSDGSALKGERQGLPVPTSSRGWLLGSVERISSCDVLVVDTSWIRNGQLELAITGEAPPDPIVRPDASPAITAGRELFGTPARTRFRFALPRSRVADHHAERAVTVALRFVEGAASASRLTCLRRHGVAENLAETLSRPWKVELEGEARFAVPVRPGAPAVIRTPVPEGAVLRFGYGVPPDQELPSGVEVSATPRGAENAQLLFRVEAVPAGAWLDAEVDLGRYAGREVVIELRTVAAGERPGHDAHAYFAHPVVAGPQEGGRPNVILISVDTLRADHLELYGYEKATMPNLTAWAQREAVVFDRAVAQAPWTLPSHLSMLTGIDPLVHGVNFHRPAPEGLLLLPEILYAHGYRTLAVTGGAYLDPQFGLDQGFERFRYYRGIDHGNELDQNLAVAVDWLREVADRPFFLFFHTYDVHEPYYARDPYYEQFSGGAERYPPVVTRPLPKQRELGFQSRREMAFQEGTGGPPPEVHRVRAMYDSGIAHTDQGLGRLLAEIEGLGIADETVVIFTSDHGEALGEHGLAGHADLFDHTLMVPLILKLPGGQSAGERIAEQVRSIDLLPTLLDLLGIPAPPAISGGSLLPLIEGVDPLGDSAAISYQAIGNRGISIRSRQGDKYVLADAAWKPTAAPTEQLFDLRSDPEEIAPSTTESPRMRQLRRQAQRRLRDTASGLHLRFSNPSGRALCGVLSSDAFRHNSVKVPAPESFAHWMGAGRVRLSLPPEEQTSLIVLPAVEAAAAIRFQAGRCRGGAGPGNAALAFEPLALELPLASITDPQRRWLKAGQWRPSREVGGGGADAVLSVAWVGPLFAPDEGDRAAPAADDELEERLRALGYL